MAESSGPIQSPWITLLESLIEFAGTSANVAVSGRRYNRGPADMLRGSYFRAFQFLTS